MGELGTCVIVDEFDGCDWCDVREFVVGRRTRCGVVFGCIPKKEMEIGWKRERWLKALLS